MTAGSRDSATSGDDKRTVRAHVAAGRGARSDTERSAAAAALARRVLALPEVAAATTVAAYASLRTEPGTGPLRAVLRSRGVRVLLPVLLRDDDLDWAVDDDTLLPSRRRALVEPSGPRLGPGAVATAEVVVCPAIAVALDGTRLGRGGGSYDRALARAAGLLVALLYDDEVVESLPHDAHDRPVQVAVTPTRTLRLAGGGLSPRPPRHPGSG